MFKPVIYKSNSIIYFKGDTADSIYILKSGSVVLKYQDIETGEELKEFVATGEFFGVRAALGKYPREDTAFVVKDAETLVLTVPEFEDLVMKNTRIIMKMLRVFSNQLRRIHKKLNKLMSTDETKDPEEGLFEIGKYYQQSGMNVQALYAYRRYLIYYPAGRFADKAQESLRVVEALAQNKPKPTVNTNVASSEQESKDNVSNDAKDYYNGVKLLNTGKYNDALNVFKKVVTKGKEKEFIKKSQFEIGRCLFFMEKYKLCIKHFTAMEEKYPKHQDLPEAIFYIANTYTKMGFPEKARKFYKKLLSLVKEGSSIHEKATKALSEI